MILSFVRPKAFKAVPPNAAGKVGQQRDCSCVFALSDRAIALCFDCLRGG